MSSAPSMPSDANHAGRQFQRTQPQVVLPELYDKLSYNPDTYHPGPKRLPGRAGWRDRSDPGVGVPGVRAPAAGEQNTDADQCRCGEQQPQPVDTGEGRRPAIGPGR